MVYYKYMNGKTKMIIGLVILVVLIVLGMRVVLRGRSTSTAGGGQYDTFAMCLKNKNVSFYGAFWCPHCQEQKKLFGASASLLPYIECSTPDAKGQTQICKDKAITGYPTWIFADGSRMSGVLSFADLSQKSGCPLQ